MCLFRRVFPMRRRMQHHGFPRGTITASGFFMTGGFPPGGKNQIVHPPIFIWIKIRQGEAFQGKIMGESNRIQRDIRLRYEVWRNPHPNNQAQPPPAANHTARGNLETDPTAGTPSPAHVRALQDLGE